MKEFYLEKERKTSKLNKHWQFSIGGDHAKQALRADYLKQLHFIHEELGIQYIRFHGIFCDDMHTLPGLDEVLPIPGGEVLTERSFYYCGAVYDGILEAGMKPFVELSFMPTTLAKNKETGKIFYGSNFSLPNEFEAWGEHIKEFIKYLIHRYGEKEVESWYFEVWNEPDLRGSFFLGTKEEYFKLYEVTVRAIKSVDKNLRVGGPSTSGSRWIDEFVDFCEKNQLPLDFVSTHQYSGDPLTGVSESNVENENEDPAEQLKAAQQMFQALPKDVRHIDIMRMIMGEPSETKEIPNNVFRLNAKRVKNQAKEYPVIYDEWNFSAILTDYGNDTKKAAAYIIKTALDVEQSIQGSSVWCFSDIFEEMHQFTDEFHGGFGVQTIHGIPKPTFYALKMLCSLAPNRIDLGNKATDEEIGLAAFEDEERLQLLFFRQKMRQQDMPKEEIMVKTELDVKPKKMVLERIDDTHCNPLKIWESQGKPLDLNQKEVLNILNESKMRKEEVDVQYQDGCVIVLAKMNVNDIYLYTIYK